MANWISEKTVKTRKRHRCHGCLQIFSKGTEMTASVNTDGGEIYTLYFCVLCKRYIDTHQDEFEYDDIYPGYVCEGIDYFDFLTTEGQQ